MIRPSSISDLNPVFNEFLYASIGEKPNGMLQSVLSALARQGVDPWQEAADLTYLSTDDAVRKMAALIESLPGGSWVRPNSENIAARLVELLPRPISQAHHVKPTSLPSDPANRSSARYPALFVVFILVMLCSEWLATRTQPAAPPEANATPVSSVTASGSTSTSGR